MKTEIKVPGMGESISQATIGTIFKATGEKVNVDEEVLEIETDKVNQALYAPSKGIITWNVKSGDTVSIGQVLGYVEEGEVQEKPKEIKPNEEIKPKEVEPKPTLKGARLSKEAFFEEEKEEKPVTIKASENPLEKRTKMSKVRKVIAAKMVEALQTSAMLTTFNEVDMSQVIAIREKYKEAFLKEHGVKLGFMPFFVKAVCSSLKEFPLLNAYIDGEEIVERLYYNLGVAVGTDKGVFVPVIKNCENLSFPQIEKAIVDFSKKAKEGSIEIGDLQGGGFTITNGGVYGSLLSTPILNPPQSGILGMHKIVKRPIAVEDAVVIRPMMYLALSYDHRIVDGKEAVSFLVHIKNHLEDPSLELLDL